MNSKTSSSIIFLLFCNVIWASDSHYDNQLSENNSYTQYVLLPAFADAGNYLLKVELKVSDLQSRITNCGLNCQLVKLSTTETKDKGLLKINLRDKYAGCEGTWDVGFYLENGNLITPVGTYFVYLEGDSCVRQAWEMEVSENLQGARYSISITKVHVL